MVLNCHCKKTFMLVTRHENIPGFLQQVACLNWLVTMYAAFLLSFREWEYLNKPAYVLQTNFFLGLSHLSHNSFSGVLCKNHQMIGEQ